MIFTGKAKEQFEKWYNNQMWNDDYLDNDVHCFYLLHESMQWGAIQDFADDSGLDLDAFRYGLNFYSELRDLDLNTISHNTDSTVRQQARNEAIEQLNEYLNKEIT